MRHNTTFVNKTVIALQPANMPGVHSSHIFSACTILKPASSIQDRVSWSQRHPLNMVGQMSDFDTSCWTRYWRVHGFPIRKDRKETLPQNSHWYGANWRIKTPLEWGTGVALRIVLTSQPRFQGLLSRRPIEPENEVADFSPMWPGLHTLNPVLIICGLSVVLGIVFAPRVFRWFLQIFSILQN